MHHAQTEGCLGVGGCRSRPDRLPERDVRDRQVGDASRGRSSSTFVRALWKQPLILTQPGRPRGIIGADVASGLADLESYGQMVLANPDFVARLKAGAPMNAADRNTFFGDEHGYTDYPLLATAKWKGRSSSIDATDGIDRN
jgi:2,4-dienoyl-CoA reductase-like NADH-dependent reductase (Old Yellow Enzyme family)